MQLKPIHVLLAEDHPLLMTGFAMSLTSHGIELIGQTTTPEETVKKYEELLPDVLVLDIRSGERLSGLDTAAEILRKFPHAKIVFLSQFDQNSLIKEAYKIGGYAFLTKACGPIQFAEAIKKVHEGEIYFLPKIAERLASLSVRGDRSALGVLDAREVEVMTFMAQGLTSAEIAEKLNLSLKTISNASQSIKAKLRVSRAADITRLAVKHGLIEP